MTTTHVVSLFLPYTILFHDRNERRLSSPEKRQPPQPHLLAKSSPEIDLPKRPSTASLFDGHVASHAQHATVADEFFSNLTPGAHDQQYAATPGNPRSLMRSHAHVPDWGKQAVFNQPRSRAGPLPSGSILDFARAYEQLQQNRHLGSRNGTLLSSHASRATSSDRGFDHKTWTVGPAVQGNGGLTNAMRQASHDSKTDLTWVGTLGFPTDLLPESMREDISDLLVNEYQALPVYICDKDLDGHYAHYCKTILWPIFHYQVPDHPKSKAYADHSWGFYKTVNQAFADGVVSSYKRGDIIWIHDYHLLLVPRMVREKLPDAQIGFFLHTAFPSSEVFRCLSTRTELLEGMLGANLVAFQTDEYAQHFLQTCSRILTVETTSEGVQLDDHFVNVVSQPIGINPAATVEARRHPEVQQWIELIREKYPDKRIIVGRDKLDNIRGVRQKLLSYELFLNKFPEWREKVVLIQVATSTNEQSELLTTVSDIVTRIDSVHSTLAHQPLVFLKQDISFSQYLALLTVADVLIITSLRDGMNLTAHEYIFCQDGKDNEKKHGPLILSEFTGSAAVFGGYQIPINPWDYQQQACAIRQALEMEDDERQSRWSHLHDIVLKHTGGAWAKSLTESLAQVHEEHAAHDATSIPRLSFAQISDKYKAAKRRVFILDYEGTLAAHRTHSGIALGSPDRVMHTLSELLQDPKNLVYVMSGRMPDELDTTFRTLPKLGLIAENGCFMREANSDYNEWVGFPDMNSIKQWKSAAKGVLKYYLERMEGSYIEERHCSLLMRFEKCEDKEASGRMMGECADHVNGAFNKMNVHAVPINHAILVESLDWSKGSAAEQILDDLRQKDTSAQPVADFLMVVGDDREDEVIFRWANDLGKNKIIQDVFTVSVGKRNTQAQATLTQGTTGLLTVLSRLAKISVDALPMDYFNMKNGHRA